MFTTTVVVAVPLLYSINNIKIIKQSIITGMRCIVDNDNESDFSKKKARAKALRHGFYPFDLTLFYQLLVLKKLKNIQ